MSLDCQFHSTYSYTDTITIHTYTQHTKTTFTQTQTPISTQLLVFSTKKRSDHVRQSLSWLRYPTIHFISLFSSFCAATTSSDVKSLYCWMFGCVDSINSDLLFSFGPPNYNWDHTKSDNGNSHDSIFRWIIISGGTKSQLHHYDRVLHSRWWIWSTHIQLHKWTILWCTWRSFLFQHGLLQVSICRKQLPYHELQINCQLKMKVLVSWTEAPK